MNTKQLWQALCSDDFTNKYFTGIFPYDLLNVIHEKPKLIICNTDSSEGSGEHWILFFFNEDKSVDFYDSLGNDLSAYDKSFYKFIKKYVNKYEKSLIRTQPVNTSLCGHYCLFYAYFKCRGYNMEQIVTKMINTTNIEEFVNCNFDFLKISDCKCLQNCTLK